MLQYPKFLHELRDTRKQKDFDNYIKNTHSTYHVASRTRLPETDHLHLHLPKETLTDYQRSFLRLGPYP